MGSGKTTTVWRAIERVSKELPDKKYIPCYLRLSLLHKLFAAFETENSDANVLATALLACFTDNKLLVHKALYLDKVADRAFETYGSKYFLLHIDEFQSSPEVTKQLIRACGNTIWNENSYIHVIPIVSGIPGLDFPVEVSTWAKKQVQLGSLPLDGLWSSLLKAIGLPHGQYGDYKNLSILFRDCGGYAFQVVILAEKIKENLQGLTQDLSPAEAKIVFQNMLTGIENVYSESRWHAMFSSKYKEATHGIARHRPSWPKTKHAMKQVMLFVLTKKRILSMEDQFVTDVTWEKCKLAGMVDFVQEDKSGWIAKCSLFALLAMNKIANVIPAMAHLDNAFDDGWQAHERVALVSFMVHLQIHDAGTKVLLQDCRPEAYFKTKATKVEIIAPADMKFQTEEKGLADDTELSVGSVLLVADNEPGVDGVMLFDGFVDDVPRQILVLSQSKKRGNRVEDGYNTGQVTTERKTTSDVLPLLSLIRDAKKKLPPAIHGAFVVLDLFSDWIEPARGWNDGYLKLEKDEALIITSNSVIDSVLGGLAARKREVLN